MCLIRTYLGGVYNSKKKVPGVMRAFPGYKEEQKGNRKCYVPIDRSGECD